MTSRYNPDELDAAWDNLFDGGALPVGIGDDLDRYLLDQLKGLPRVGPSAAFVHSLDQALFSATGPLASTQAATIPPYSRHEHLRARLQTRFDDLLGPRWARSGYALAAIAFVLALSAVVLFLQSRSEDDDRVIPAASYLAGQGPPTSSGIQTTTWFSKTYSVDELAAFGIDQWNWVDLTRMVIGPGERPLESDLVEDAAETQETSLQLLTLAEGALAVELNDTAQLYRFEDNASAAEVGPGTVELQVGDTLVYRLDALDTFWNPADADSVLFFGSLTADQYFLERPDRVKKIDGTSGLIPSGLGEGVDTLDVSLEHVVIEPGETYAYAILPQTLLMGLVNGGLMELQAWKDGEPFGKPIRVISTAYLLHNYGTGYFTLTNTGSGSVTVTLLRMAPPESGELPSPPAEPIDAPFGNWSPTKPDPVSGE
jgi:hypothetical protein